MQLRTFFRKTTATAELASAQEVIIYATWREACDGVTEAYRTWAAATHGERWSAHAAYLAALEREEDAALDYQRSLEQLHGAVGGRVSS